MSHFAGDQNVEKRLLANLNAEQLAAVTLPAQPALILAGAGSGKTRVLTTRIAWLMQTGQVSPGGVMAVTFANKSAKEMLTRLSAMLPVAVRGMWIGTFHGLCNRFLRAHWKLASLPQSFQILDSSDQQSAVKRVIKSMKLKNSDEDLLDAIREGAVLRVRPKAMTVAVILAGLLPIMWGTGTGSEVMQRIAAPMVGGMISAPLLSMFVIPAAYLLMRRKRADATTRWRFWRRPRETA